VINLNKTVYQGYPALKMTFNTQSPSRLFLQITKIIVVGLGNFVDNELNSHHITETEELTPQPGNSHFASISKQSMSLGDIIRPDSSDCLYIICSAKPESNETQTPQKEEENKDEKTENQALFDFIKVGTISNINGHGILQEVTSQENVDLKTNEIGTYKKLFTIKFMKLYVVVSLLSFYVVHFTGYKAETTVPNQELYDLLMKHH